MDQKQYEQMMKGAFILIENDDGFFYNKWSETKENISECGKLGSSHGSCTPQFRLNGGILVNATTEDNWKTSTSYDLLIGCKENKENKPQSFFQFERHNLNTIKNAAIHFVADYVTYRHQFKKKLNLGPFGSSKFIENSPLTILRCLMLTPIVKNCKR